MLKVFSSFKQRSEMRSIRAIATDYDETIAHAGYVPRATLDAMERFRASGRILILDTGRGLDDLRSVFPELHRFDRVVTENGAVLFFPETGKERLLTQPLPHSFIDALRRRGVSAIPKRRVVIDIGAEHKAHVLAAMRDADIPLQLTFNNESMLVLPFGVHKGSGLLHALEGTGVTLAETAGIGDAANDFDLLDACGFKIAVPNAIPDLLERAHHVLTFVQLVDRILAVPGVLVQ